jgi:hypothetical protein
MLARPTAGAAPRGARLSVPLAVGRYVDEVELEPPHYERLLRTAAYVAIRNGRLAPGEPVAARLVPGQVRERHGHVLCLDACAVELRVGEDHVVDRVGFPRAAFSAFALARAVRVLAAAGQPLDRPRVVHALHLEPGDDEPLVLALPALASVSLAGMLAGARATGAPADGWIATFVGRAVAAGLDAIEHESRSTGVEAAGRLTARVGFDAGTRRFVRVLERLVISRATRASATAVVSTAASWGEFLATVPAGGPQAFSSLHTHVHLTEGDTLGPDDLPCISIEDVMTHYVHFPDPLSAALIVTLFPGARAVTLYGYGPDAALHEEPGWWTLHD